MDTLEKRLNAPFADTIALMEQNNSSRFSYVKGLGKKAVSTGLMLGMLYAGTTQVLPSATDSYLESSTGYFEKADPNNGVKKKKKGPWLWITAAAAAVAAAVVIATSGKEKPPVQQKYTVNLAGRNVEKLDEVVSGDITFKLSNGTTVSGSNSSNMVFEGSNKIVDASVSGQGDYFPNDLIFRDVDTGALLGKKDAKGFASFSVNDGQKIRVEYIKTGFDIELFKKCLSLDVTPVVKRYDKAVVNVGIWNGGVDPSATDIKNLTDFIDKYNVILDGKMKLNYIGKISAPLEDGMTYAIGKNVVPGHDETVVNNVITKSNFQSNSNADLALVLAEGDGAASARGDGGFPKTPYVDIAKNDFTAEGKRVIHLHYCLPAGYAPNGSMVSTSLSSIASQQPGSFQGSGSAAGGSRSGSNYNSPGNKAGPVGKTARDRDSSARNDYRARR